MSAKCLAKCLIFVFLYIIVLVAGCCLSFKIINMLVSDNPNSIEQQQNKNKILQQQLKRDDEILQKIFTPWDRSKPLFSKPVEISAYTSTINQCDDDPYINASNRVVRPGTIAVSRDLLNCVDLGEKVILTGYGTFTVADVMNKRYTNTVDIWMGDITAARLHGRKKAEMLWQ